MAKILLIEDEPDQIKVVKFRLEASGYEVVTAENAQEGIKIAQEEKPDLILMDMLMPGLDGFEATRMLKSDSETKDIPVIAITAMGTVDVEDRCAQAGASDFIKKPYDSQELVQKVKKYLEGNNA